MMVMVDIGGDGGDGGDCDGGDGGDGEDKAPINIGNMWELKVFVPDRP